jgi:hypothetical protein
LKNSDAVISTEPDLSLKHLDAELARIDVLIRREVWRWQRAGQDPSDILRGLYITDDEVEALLSRPLATGRGQSVELEADEAEAFAAAQARAVQGVQSALQAAR